MPTTKKIAVSNKIKSAVASRGAVKSPAKSSINSRTKSPTATKSKKPNKKVSNKIRLTIVNAPSEKCFWVHYGPVLKNLQELSAALKTMSDDQYFYHASGAKNDFALWVSEVLQKPAAAKELSRATSRSAAAKALSRHLR